MIGWELPPHNSGGLGVACANLSQALADDGINLSFTLPYQTSASFCFPLINCATCSQTANDNLYPPFNPYQTVKKKRSHQTAPHPISAMEKQVEAYAKQVLAFAMAHQNDFDLVHAHDWMSLPAAMKIKQELGKPYIAHIHSTEFDRSLQGDLHFYIGSCEAQGMQIADRIIAVSYYTKRVLSEKYFINPEKIDVVHNGVVSLLQDINQVETTFAYQRPVIVFMGRLTVQKGPDYFLQLAAKVIATRPDALFIVSGMGDMYEQLLFSSAGKSLSANILFSGFVRGGAQTAILKRADVFVMPSVSEPFGLVATEAAILGTPVIASKTSGVVEVMKGGANFDFWDIDAMAAEILHLLADKAYRRQVIAQQIASLSQATWKKAAKKIEKIYTQVTDKKKSPRKKSRRPRVS